MTKDPEPLGGQARSRHNEEGELEGGSESMAEKNLSDMEEPDYGGLLDVNSKILISVQYLTGSQQRY